MAPLCYYLDFRFLTDIVEDFVISSVTTCEEVLEVRGRFHRHHAEVGGVTACMVLLTCSVQGHLGQFLQLYFPVRNGFVHLFQIFPENKDLQTI